MCNWYAWNISFTTNNRANEVMEWLKSESLKDDLDVQIHVIHPMLELTSTYQDDNTVSFYSYDNKGVVQMGNLFREFLKLVKDRWENEPDVSFYANMEMGLDLCGGGVSSSPATVAPAPQKCTCGGSRFGSHSSWCDLVSAS